MMGELPIMKEDNSDKILVVLRKNFALPSWVSMRSPFETLVVTILSQNTSGRNVSKAFENLSKKFSLTPEALAKADEKEIQEAIKNAGLYRNKAKVIKKAARKIVEEFGGSLDFIYSLPLEEARKILLSFDGVGPKTADVILLFCAGKPTLPVDTHVARVSKRLQFVSWNANYEEIRQTLQRLYQPKDYLAVHLLFISLGRKICKARKPMCRQCPINMLCPSKQFED
ncbi:MAG: endonuclease III [Candidatus Bathyarchaeia archaeon]